MANKQINGYIAASTIDPINDYFLLDPAGTGAYVKINRNTVMGGLTGAPADISTTQTLSNKVIANTNSITVKDGSLTLQSSGSTTKQAQFSLTSITAGQTRIMTLPDYNATLATLAGSETLTNKTLTSPAITGGTLDNTTVTVDAITGHTSPNTGTIYGISVTAGLLGTAALASNAVQAAQLAQNAITLGYAQITANFTTTTVGSLVSVTGLSTTVTVPSGGRKVRITAYCANLLSTQVGINGLQMALFEGVTQLAISSLTQYQASWNQFVLTSAVLTPSIGSHTYNVEILQQAAGTLTASASATNPAYILVEAI